MADRELGIRSRDLPGFDENLDAFRREIAEIRRADLAEARRLALARDLALLFVGAFAQWLLTTLFTRWAVFNQPALVFVAVFALQSLWWLNIQNTLKRNGTARWLAWSAGAAFGAWLGVVIG